MSVENVAEIVASGSFDQSVETIHGGGGGSSATATVTIFTPSVSGQYRITVVVVAPDTEFGGALLWTDEGGSESIAFSSNSDNDLTMGIRALTGDPVQISTSSGASGPVQDPYNPGTFTVYWVVEQLGVDSNIPVNGATASITVTSAQLLALHDTPLQLIAAPGSGLTIIPRNIRAVYDYDSISYTVTPTSPSGFQIGWGSSALANSQAVLSTQEFIDQSFNQLQTVDTGLQGEFFPLYQIINQPIMLVTNDVLTDGNGTVMFTIEYDVVAVS